MKGLPASLPWPPAALKPNDRAHWRTKAAAAKQHKRDCCIACQAAGIRALDADRLHVAIVFHAPDSRRRDMDNLIASMKAGIDGISLATGIDDSRFDYALSRGPVRQGGAVEIVVTPLRAIKTDAQLRAEIIGSTK